MVRSTVAISGGAVLKKKKIKDLTDLTVNAPELPVVFDSDAEVSSLGVAHL